MSEGPLSPDGRHQWNGTEWEKIPAPPGTAHNWFQVALIVLVVILAFVLLFA